eukprot:3848645-Amphidinium_carterae.2
MAAKTKSAAPPAVHSDADGCDAPLQTRTHATKRTGLLEAVRGLTGRSQQAEGEAAGRSSVQRFQLARLALGKLAQASWLAG